MSGDGTKFSIDVDVDSTSVVPAAAALAALADRLTAASAASTQAAAAVQASEAAYRQAEATAAKAALAVERIGLAADAQRGKLAAALAVGDESGADRAAAKLQNLVARQAEAATKAASATSAMNDQAVALDALKGAAMAAADDEAKLSKSFEQMEDAAKASSAVASSAEGASFKVNEMSEAFGKLGGPLGNAGRSAFGAADGFKKMNASLGAAGPYAAVAVAIVAITTAAIAATAAIANWAINLSEGNRSAELLNEGLAGTAAGGQILTDTISSLGKKLPFTTAELNNMAGELSKSGLHGKALSDALEDNATKAAKVKWGPDFSKAMLTSTKQAEIFHDSISKIFNLKIDGLLGGLSKLVALFDENSASGNAIKVLFSSMFQPLIDGIASVIPKVVAGFLQLEIAIVKVAIFARLHFSYFKEAAEIIGVILVGALAILAAAIVISFLPLVVAVAVTVAVIEALIWLGQTAYDAGAALVAGIGDAFNYVTGAVDAAIAYLKGISLSDIGAAMMAGLVAGITGGGSGVLGSMTGIIGNAVKGVRGLLDSHSPSRVFMDIGNDVGDGMAIGVDDSADKVQGSLESMVAPPSPKAAAGASGAGGASGCGGNTFNITVNADGGDGESIAMTIRRVITETLEGDVAQLGGAVPSV